MSQKTSSAPLFGGAEDPKRGREVLAALAETYPQLYLTPGPEGAKLYPGIVRSGEDAPEHSLSGFHSNDDDTLEFERTPAGTVPVITLREREDFERFLRLMAHKGENAGIPATQGAAILDGVINWTKIRAHEAEFFASGGKKPDWDAELERFLSVKENYRDALIVLSWGPYSAVPAEETEYPEEEWLRISHVIRKTHECTHFICRRLFPELKDAVWDELVADAVGITAALGHFDRALAERFLGIREGRYTRGRLENYVPDGDRSALDAAAGKAEAVLRRFETVLAKEFGGIYSLPARLEEEIGCWKQS
ncbi:MAG: hypothetical protein IIU41_01375 [Oscillospiraceae bacterium]|nr:hypothetical protein [Oscillospiraceae bacterium]